MNKKIISLLVTIIVFATSVFSCYTNAEEASGTYSSLEQIAQKGTEEVTDKITGEDQWKQYIGDIETFAYGLIINELEYVFDVFPAYVDTSDGNTVYGLAYTDYSNCYTDENEEIACFESGFLPFNGELPVTQEDFDSGLIINPIEYSDDHTAFIWTVGSEQIRNHCVVYNQYLQYGTDNNGTIYYETSEYVPGTCDESIGSLYSYDEAKYLFDTDVGSYLSISGKSLASQIDFALLEEEINKALMTQDINFSAVDIVSCANFAQGAIVSYLLSLQEETFLGYNVAELIEAAEQLDPLECYRITNEGLITLELENGNKASNVTKWLVGVGCAIVAITATVGSMIFIECPPLSVLAGTVAGTAIEIFMQVVISEKELNNIDWRKVAIGAAAGALSGFIGPYIFAANSGANYFLIDSCVDSLIGGIERAAEAWIEGKNAKEVIESFGMGAAMGFGLSMAFKGVASGISKAAGKLSSAAKKIGERIVPKLTQKVSAIKNKISDIFEKVGEKLNKKISKLKEAADKTIFHSEHLSKKIAQRQVSVVLSKNSDQLLDDSIKYLSPDDIVDLEGEAISKETVKKLAREAKNDSTIAYFKKGEELIPIVKKNSVVGIVFDPNKYQVIDVPGGLTKNRSVNFTKVATELKKRWKDTKLIPKDLLDAIAQKGDLEDISASTLVDIIQKSSWVIHENTDMLTATLVPRFLHEHTKHMGGVALVKYIESHVADTYFDRLVAAAATGVVIAAQ